MSLDRYRFITKLQAIGGVKSLFSLKYGLDMYISILITSIYLLLIPINLVNPDWFESTLLIFSIIIPLIIIEFTLFGFTLNNRNRIIKNNLFKALSNFLVI